jgi:hypothetical protein
MKGARNGVLVFMWGLSPMQKHQIQLRMIHEYSTMASKAY